MKAPVHLHFKFIVVHIHCILLQFSKKAKHGLVLLQCLKFHLEQVKMGRGQAKFTNWLI